MSSEKALIAAIVAAPDAREPWCAYRDWLIERADPRGEWIRAALEGDDKVSQRPPVDDESLMTPELYAHSHRLVLWWWRGFIDSAVLTGAMDDPPTLGTIEALFSDPHAALLRSLSILHPITTPLWQAVFARARPQLRMLRAENLGTGVDELARKLPQLDRLVLGGMFVAQRNRPFAASRAPSQRLEHPVLRELITAPTTLPALITGDFDLPRLGSLAWDLLESYDAADPEADPPGYELFTSPSSILHRPPPNLVELMFLRSIMRVRDRPITAGCEIELLASSALLSQLRVLRFEHHMSSAIALAELRDHAAAFRHLETIEVHSRASLPRAEVDALRASLERALPDTKLVVQWDRLVMRDPNAPSLLPEPVDAASRNREGRVDAMARWISGERT